MSHLKWAKNIVFAPKNIYGITKASAEAYFSNKKTLDDSKLIENSKSNRFDSSTNKSVEVEKIACENDDTISVITERERDATVQSRLSKECSKLADRKISLTSSGLNLSLDPKNVDKSSWEDFSFDRTIRKLKEETLAPISSMAAISPQGSSATSNRIVRGEPGKVLFACVPEEWFTFFIPKTGVTGFYTFLFTFGTYLVSKERYVLEHEYYGGLSMLILWWAVIKYVGPNFALYLDDQIDDYENAWKKGRNDTRSSLEQQIDEEHLLQYQCEGQFALIEAKRENVALQLEEEFRKRQMQVYSEVKDRLDYHLKVALVHERIQHKNLVEYVQREVRKSITAEMENKLIHISIDNILSELNKEESNK